MSSKILSLIVIVFFGLFILKANQNMWEIPFHDFDEAHRAEKAKRMKEYLSFLVPLTGSPQDRSTDLSLRIPVKENPQLFLYYHPERPPFVYWMMIMTTSLFGSSEWAYRLPSFFAGISIVLLLVLFIIKYEKNVNFYALFVGLISILTSSDLWLSSQYAQLDTTLTFFLFLSLASILFYIRSRNQVYLVISGLSFALSVLSKGQAAVILFFPLFFLIFIKKLSFKEFMKFCLFASIILLPWFILLQIYFGFGKVAKIFLNFAASSSLIEFSHIEAPVFWYIRWWWDSLRPGWTLFLSLFTLDIIRRNLNLKRGVLLLYIFGGLVLFSLSPNKIWWYVLPLVPVIACYIYISAKDYLKMSSGVINLSFIVILASLPIFLNSTNKVALLYGSSLTLISVIILLINTGILSKLKEVLFIIGVFFSLMFFYNNFPKIIPFHYDTKAVATYYSTLPGEKCLWVKDMPSETALYYSNAGELLPLTEGANLFPDCENFLMSPKDILNDNSFYFYNDKMLKLKEQKILFQKGNMRLVKLHEEPLVRKLKR